MQNAELNSEFGIRNLEFGGGEVERCLSELRERFAFSYPFHNAPDLPSKLTVTELKGKRSDIEMDEEAASVLNSRKSVSRSSMEYAFERPEFVIKKTGMTGAERGTALHLAMQHIKLGDCGSVVGVEREIERLLCKGYLAKEQADAIDIQKIMRFFESGIGKRLLQAQDVKREFKFSLLYDAVRFFPDYSTSFIDDNDKILVQGVIDCFFAENGELVILDFKTDYVTEETIDEKADEYKQQIAAYTEALERITELKVKERVIYFFSMDRAYEILS
jgi:ATP-dependent helicase/nuclease subunit A